MSNSSIRSINRTLLGATTPGLSGPGSNSNEGVLRIPQRMRFFNVISRILVVRVLTLCRHPVGVFCSPRRRVYEVLYTISILRLINFISPSYSTTFFSSLARSRYLSSFLFSFILLYSLLEDKFFS